MPNIDPATSPESLAAAVKQILQLQGLSVSDEQALMAARTVLRLQPAHRSPDQKAKP